jgi:hypothetical protein
MEELPQTLSAAQLCVLTDLTDQHHRRLASKGFFPPPEKARYQFTPVIQGIIRYYREMVDRAKSRTEELKQGKLERENKKLDLELDRLGKKMVLIKEVDQLHLHIGSLQKAILIAKLEREMPVRTEGKTAPEKVLIGRAIVDELCDIFSQRIDQWKETLDEPIGDAKPVAKA